MNLTELFTSIAEAIRNKKKTTKKIKASDFANEITTIEGGLDTSDATAVAMNIESGKTAYVNGNKITGAINVIDEFVETDMDASCIVVNTDEENVTTISLESMTPRTKRIMKGNSPITLGAPQTEFATAIGLTADKIKEGETVLGVEGTFAGGDVAITDASYLFYNGIRLDILNELIGLLKDVTTTHNMFYNCSTLTEIPLFDTSNVTSMSSMFSYCRKLTAIPQLDTSNVTSMSSMFNNCEKLTAIPQLDTSNVTDMSSMFNGCKLITEIPLLDTGNVTNMKSMFQKCSGLQTLPQFNMSNVTTLQDTFSDCTSLTEIPQLDISNVTDMYRTFYNCKALVTIPELDASKVNTIGGAFYNNTSLVNLGGLKNLGKAFKNTSNTLDISYSTLLTYDSLMNLITNLYDLNLTYDVANGGTITKQTLKLSTESKALLTAEEIAIATNKGWTVS